MGLVIGLIYRYLLTNTFHVFWGLALLTPLLFHLNVFEMALIKLVGGLITYFLVLLILIKTRFIHKLDNLIRLHDDEARKPDFPEALPVGV
jgi:hypothetical protein